MSKLPEWFNGEVYTEGAEVTNRFGGDSCYLNAEELSMYDFVMGCAMIPSTNLNDSVVKNWQDGLTWFRVNNPKAYMVLLD